jgi:hypothetical protein
LKFFQIRGQELKRIVIFKDKNSSPGIDKIINHLYEQLISAKVPVTIENDISNISPEDYLLPYGINPAYRCLKAGYKIGCSLMVDAYSLGWLKKIIFYIKRKKFNYYDLYYSCWQLIHYCIKEFLVILKSPNVMYVSPYDLTSMKKIFKKKNFLLVQNGVEINKENSIQKFKKERNCIILGTISYWTKVSLCELKWFIDDIFLKYGSKNREIKLVIAGMGADAAMIAYFESLPNVVFIGKVESLDEFFNQIDIFVGTVPKSVGILNKILDAFAHKRLVIGLPECFKAFMNDKQVYLSFKNDREFIDIIDKFSCDDMKVIVNQAYEFVIEQHSWIKNYEPFIKFLIFDSNISLSKKVTSSNIRNFEWIDH